MKIMSSIVDLLSILAIQKHIQTSKYLQFDGTIKLLSGPDTLVKINNDTLFLCKDDVTNKFIAKYNAFSREIFCHDWEKFLIDMGNSFVRLNHLGISYACNAFETEIFQYKNSLTNTKFSLYEEPSGKSNAKWLFIGNTIDWQSPLFEIVLTKNAPETENTWLPHFQIDIDTTLNQNKLEKKLTQCFGSDFVQWKLDIPHYGVVLVMGMLGSIDGTKIYLGVGTNLRNTQYHREQILKKFI